MNEDYIYGPYDLPDVNVVRYKYSERPFRERDYTEFDRPYHEVSGMGALGFVLNPGRNDYHHITNAAECAKVANQLSARMGRPTTGNAWNTYGIFGDSVLINGYDSIAKLNVPRININARDMLAKDVVARNLSSIDVHTGDIIGLSYKGSPYRFTATTNTKRNTPNTHTGRALVLPSGPEGRRAYVIHNVGGNVKVEPLRSMANPNNYVGVTNIIRPNASPDYRSYLTYGMGPNDRYFDWKREMNLHKYDNEE